MLIRLAEGSIEAFTELYKYYQPRLERFLSPFKEIDAEEIIQDIFLKLWLKRAALAGVRSFDHYVFRMAKNRLMDLRSSNQARIKREGQTVPLEEEVITPVNEVEYKEFYAAALTAIRQLSPRQQRIYQLSVFNDYSLDEIAAIMKLSKSVVIKQLYLASKFVRKQVGKRP